MYVTFSPRLVVLCSEEAGSIFHNNQTCLNKSGDMVSNSGTRLTFSHWVVQTNTCLHRLGLGLGIGDWISLTETVYLLIESGLIGCWFKLFIRYLNKEN